MRVPISELMEYCFDDQIHLSGEDEVMNQELKERILNQIRHDVAFQRKHRAVKYLLAGLVATATVGTVFAAGVFVMHKQQIAPGETESGSTVVLNGKGETETEIINYEGAALSITFSCEEVPHEVWVHPGYLPDIPEKLNPEFMIEGDPGWYQYLSGESGFTDPVPWQISVRYAQADTKMILLGTLETETEDNWDGLQVTEVSISRDDLQENYVMLFDPEEGFLITVAGTMDLEELEKIAKGLDIRVSDEPVEASILDTGIGLINLGRG